LAGKWDIHFRMVERNQKVCYFEAQWHVSCHTTPKHYRSAVIMRVYGTLFVSHLESPCSCLAACLGPVLTGGKMRCGPASTPVTGGVFRHQRGGIQVWNTRSPSPCTVFFPLFLFCVCIEKMKGREGNYKTRRLWLYIWMEVEKRELWYCSGGGGGGAVLMGREWLRNQVLANGHEMEVISHHNP
jgi:hypothetical protein